MTRRLQTVTLSVLLFLALSILHRDTSAGNHPPILFVTQVPNPFDFTTITSTFGNHLNWPGSVPRGGDLWIRYGDGTLRNLTAATGYGMEGHQGATSIAVRDPEVHWDGEKAIFSMIVGAPERYSWDPFYWQLYEITDFRAGETPVITKVANQPADYNNISPIYTSDDQIVFTTDRPRNGERHLYPQLDEYEEAPTVSGLWKLNPANGDLTLLDHSPSGNFDPMVDSFGRILFTRWDHLQRDQQADSDDYQEAMGQPCSYCTFDWSDESAESTPLFDTRHEIFPEPRTDPPNPNLNRHTFNHFFPWMIHQDGSEIETLNHIGRHELHGYFNRSFNNDGNLSEFIDAISDRTNPNTIHDFHQMSEDPLTPGRYLGIDAPEFYTHAAGQIVAMQAAPTDNPDNILIEYITHRDTANASDDPSENHSGLYRNPAVLSDGTLIAVHTPETRIDTNTGTGNAWGSRYDFRIKSLALSGDHFEPQLSLTGGISETVTWYSPDVLLTYSGDLWELQPVEVRTRPRPVETVAPALPAPEAAVFTATNTNEAGFRTWLRANGLAVIVSRDVTTRDQADVQQPFNLRVPGGTQTVGATGTVYDVSHMQIYQGDLLRSLSYNYETPREGRRVLARELHDAPNIGTNGSVTIAPDGSVAAFVPAERALTWQLTDPSGEGVVRERYWLTFQAGEVRVCASCHGLNTEDQAGADVPQNEPQALATLLNYWQDEICSQSPTPTGCAEVPLAVVSAETATHRQHPFYLIFPLLFATLLLLCIPRLVQPK